MSSVANGRTRSRATSIGFPQRWQIPYEPSSIRTRASSTCASICWTLLSSASPFSRSNVLLATSARSSSYPPPMSIPTWSSTSGVCSSIASSSSIRRRFSSSRSRRNSPNSLRLSERGGFARVGARSEFVGVLALTANLRSRVGPSRVVRPFTLSVSVLEPLCPGKSTSRGWSGGGRRTSPDCCLIVRFDSHVSSARRGLGRRLRHAYGGARQDEVTVQQRDVNVTGGKHKGQLGAPQHERTRTQRDGGAGRLGRRGARLSPRKC